jgi:hypothetical protein
VQVKAVKIVAGLKSRENKDRAAMNLDWKHMRREEKNKMWP